MTNQQELQILENRLGFDIIYKIRDSKWSQMISSGPKHSRAFKGVTPSCHRLWFEGTREAQQGDI